MTPDERLLPEAIRGALTTRTLGKRIYYLPEVDSTNRLALDLARLGEAAGTLVITDFQSKGRGRDRRLWVSPPGKNLLFTLILRPNLSSQALLPISLAFSLSIAETLSGPTGAELAVKWPNDVVAADGKLCGILSESSTRAGRAAFVVVGIGINVNMGEEEFTPPADHGVSCYTLTGAEHDRSKVLARVLEGMESTFERFVVEGFAPFVEAYEGRLLQLNKMVSISGKGVRSGTVVGVQEDGGLMIETPDGAGTVVYDQEVTVQ